MAFFVKNACSYHFLNRWRNENSADVSIGNFNKDYVKTEIFPREIGRKISEAEEIRHASDYDNFYIAKTNKKK